MWIETALGASLIVAGIATWAWVRVRRELALSVEEQQAHAKSSRVLEHELRLAEMMASGAPLQEVLDALTHSIEELAPDCACTILLLDADRHHLLAGSGGSLPSSYMAAVNGLAIGPDVGACGSAAYRNETVVVTDIANDYRFAGAKDFILSHGLRSCWSVPIRDAANQVLGTFAMYHRRPSTPSERELKIVEAGAYLAGNAIERLRAKERLRENEERITLAERAASLGVWELDLETTTMAVSEEMASQLGLARSSTRLKLADVETLIDRDDWSTLRQAFTNAAQSNGSFHAEFRVAHGQGVFRSFRTQGRLESESGRPKRLSGACMEITKEKEMVAQLQRAMHAKSDFLANMSHEIRTPLNGLLGTVELLLDSAVTQEQRDHVDTIRCCGETLLGLVDDILDLSKIEAGKLTLERIPFAVDRLVNDAAALTAPMAAMRNLELVREVPSELPAAVVGDPQRLRQVLLNLLSNAVKFTEHGRVTLGVSCDQRDDGVDVTFVVRDTGVGIPADVQERIFESFTQADNSTTRRFGGTGLGLTISRRLMMAMGGALTLESEVGTGSVFRATVRLPLGTASELPARMVGSPIERSEQSLRILLAEDNPVNQKVAAALLAKMGHQVQIAENGARAVQALGAAEYDLVLMDCEMPEMDGYAATRAIRALTHRAHVPIVAMTAYAMPEDRQRCLDAGMDDYVSKPISTERLAAAIDRLRSQPSPRAA
jgi:two-component system, sensor histidine kinase